MRRRRIILSVAIIASFVGLILFGLAAMIKREPRYYRQAEIAEGYTRDSLSAEAISRCGNLFNGLVGDTAGWGTEITSDQLNAYFQSEQFQNVGGDENLPDGFSAPRVKFENDRMRLGVRYGKGFFSTVFTLELKVWIVPNTLNTFAVEIVSLQAGSLPLSPSNLVDRISQQARRENIDISWYRKEDHPVAIMRLQADLNRPTFHVDQIKFTDGQIAIAGRSTDPFAGPRAKAEKK